MPDEYLTGSLEENVLTILCWHDTHAPALASRITPDLFSTRTYRDIAKVSMSHITRFSMPPKDHLRDLFEDKLRRGSDDGKLLKQTLDAMEKLSIGIQVEFVLEELDNFIQTRQLSLALENAMELLQKGKLEAAQDAVHNVNTKRSMSSGIWLHDTTQSLNFLNVNEEDRMASGVNVLDDMGACPARETLFLFLAPPNKGKSWFLVNAGRANIMHGRSVLHITLEMSEDKTSQRYVQNIFALSREDVPLIRVPKFKRDELGRCIDIDFNEFDATSMSSTRREELEYQMQPFRQRAPLLIKGFSSGSLSTQQLSAYLEYLARQQKFVPDVVLIDYWDIMKIDKNNMRIDIGDVGVQLRAIAQDRKLAMVTCTQGNRATATAKEVRRQHVAEDWSKMMTSDTVVTYSQTDAEEGLGLARLYVDKSRDTKRGYTVLVSQSYSIGQFAIDSVLMNSRLRERTKKLSGDDTDAD